MADELTETYSVEPEIAAHYVRRLEANIDVASKQLTSTSIWLSASLLAINGAAAVAAIQAMDHFHRDIRVAIILFGSGVIFALLSGAAIQAFCQLVSGPLDALLLVWKKIEVRGDVSLLELQSAGKGVTRITWWSFVCPLLGWVSGIAFIAGGWILAGAL